VIVLNEAHGQRPRVDQVLAWAEVRAAIDCGTRDCVAWMWGTKVSGRNSPDPISYSSDTDIVRASEPQHPVQRSGVEDDFGRLAPVGAQIEARRLILLRPKKPHRHDRF
jgi:hypothetical protein